ncbi:MAG: MATE family efflux transporter [Peptococcaceae bacterium]|nr:MATE family efflux transporter [Peptococcaceae bacterium]
MHKVLTAEERYTQMTETPIPRLVTTLAVPTVISMLITAVYNLADTFFVGKISLGGTSATGAVGVVFSLMAIIQAIGFTLGMGSGNYISRLLGEKNQSAAEKVAATGFFTACLAGFFLTLCGILCLEPLILLLGATETILPYAKDYAFYILLAAPYMAAAFVLNNILRFQGNAFYAMLGIGTGGILNILLDPIFIFQLDMGIKGAALATVLSQLVSFTILLIQCQKHGTIPIRLHNFTFDKTIYSTILRGGVPSFYRQSLSSIATICLNHGAKPFGDPAIAAMTIVTKMFMFALSALLGFGQGFQPVCGFNYGAKKYSRVLEAFWFCLKVAAVMLLVLSLLGFIFAPDIMRLFRAEDLTVIEMGSFALRAQCLTFPFMSLVVMANMLLQTIGKNKEASLLALSRQGLFFLPVILILPHYLDMLGVQLSQPIADSITFCVALPIAVKVLHELKKQAQQEEVS